MMIAGGNGDGQWSEKRMEGGDGLRTLECLRGRLFAERAASRVAKEDAEQMGNKLIELENQLKLEIKSRNRAEKKLKFLIKKLEFLNISYVSEELEQSSLLKSDISSVSSTASSGTKGPEDKEHKTLVTNPRKCDDEDTMEKTKSSLVSNLINSVSQSSSSNQSHYCPSIEKTSSTTSKANSEKSSELQSSQNFDDSKKDDQSLKSSIEEKQIDGGNDQDQEDYVDNSLALVPVDLPIATQKTEPPIVNARVKEVLDALRQAREKIQSSMERRHMIKVGSR
ncbi:hypothetical protein F0562_016998 [Nyssa sinensis]|uniref:Uncharacterized protein n=1 Tax=Nyssa sinensis TaxID=561372 RepID=A0A5J4ZFJ5_9ASTE|nr:hypothetical protein F0562_016998 [Nyssa sinensis]